MSDNEPSFWAQIAALDPDRFLSFFERLVDREEKERERLRAPVGHLCKTMADKVDGVTFHDYSQPWADKHQVAMTLFRPSRLEYTDEPASYGCRAVRRVPEVHVRRVLSIDIHSLVRDGEDFFVEVLTAEARAMLRDNP